jgi:hypothetical protein
MKIELNSEMIVGLLRAWVKRNICSEGLEIVSFKWTEGKLTVELQEVEE